MQRIDSIPQNGIVLNKGWKFHAGDNAEWAKPNFDDSRWQSIDPTLDVSELPQMRQQAIGWLRIHFHVDSSLLNKPLAYHIFQSIASQVYINGVLTDSFGVVSSDKNKIEEWRPSNDPEGIVFAQAEQTIAVRFSLRSSYNGPAVISNYNGFLFRVSDVNRASKYNELRHQFPNEFLIFFTFFLVTSIFNFILYLNNVYNRGYLLFTTTYFFGAITCLLGYVVIMADVSLSFINYSQIGSYLFIYLSPFLFYLTIWIVFSSGKNILFWLNVALAFFSVLSGYLLPDNQVFFFILLVLVSLTNGIESTRITISSFRRGNKKAIVLIIGFIIYWISFPLSILALLKPELYIDKAFNFPDLLWVIANASNPLCLVIYLAIDFANTSKQLEKKLVEIRQLSNEKQRILLSQNETLEQQVTQRTSQLNQSIHELKITQAQLVQSEQRQSEQIVRLNEEVLNRTEEINTMKQTLASDFHDETGNLLSAITRQASLLRMNDGYSQKGTTVIDNIIANSNQLYASSRHFLWNLNNDSNDPHKLFEYLLSFGQGFYNSFGISFSAENGLPANFPGRLLPFAPLNLIFIFKEAINNVAKHADATEVKLQLTQQNGFIIFSLTDDGTWKELDINTAHHGLHNMEKRCAQNKFRFAISHPGNVGTRIEVGAPFIISAQ